jgi:hypothetical protein
MEEKTVSDEYNNLIALFKRVDKKNPPQADIEQLEDHLRKYPNLAHVGGDLVRQARLNIIEDAFATANGVRVSVEAYCKLQRDELGYKSATPLERSLIEHVVLCWLHLYTTELRYEQRMRENLSLAQGEYWEKKLSANQRRYLRAVETLARIRKLNLTIQINMAHQQIVTG